MGLISCAPDPTHKQKLIYSLTEAAIQLVPVMATLSEEPPGQARGQVSCNV